MDHGAGEDWGGGGGGGGGSSHLNNFKIIKSN